MTRTLALLALLVLPAVGPAQEPGFDVLRGLLKYHGVTPLADVPRDQAVGDLIVVVIGRPPRHPELQRLCRRGVSVGGAVLLASDGPADWSDYLPPTPGREHRTGVGGGPVFCSRPENRLADQPLRPLLRSRMVIRPDVPPDLNILAISKLPRVAADGSGVLDLPDGDHLLSPLLVLPPGSTDTNRVSVTNKPVVAVLLPSADAGLRGTVVVSASTGLFGNELAAGGPDGSPSPADNFAFDFLLARHLAGTGDRKRTRCLFVEHGTIIDNFDSVTFAAVPLPDVNPPLPPLDKLQQKLTDEANRLIGDWQDRDGPNQALHGGRPPSRFGSILAGVAVIAAVLAGMLLFRAWLGSRLPTDQPRRVTAVIDPADPAFDRLADAALRTNNLSEPARAHLRTLFAGWGTTGPDLPPVRFQGGGRREMDDAIRELWRVAHDDRTAVTAVRWKELRGMIEEVSRARDAGRWRFDPPGGSA